MSNGGWGEMTKSSIKLGEYFLELAKLHRREEAILRAIKKGWSIGKAMVKQYKDRRQKKKPRAIKTKALK